eukprot:scaffold2131_cov113-Isochrysis_galbana.AAC.1
MAAKILLCGLLRVLTPATPLVARQANLVFDPKMLPSVRLAFSRFPSGNRTGVAAAWRRLDDKLILSGA